MTTKDEFVPLKRQSILQNVGGKNQFSNLNLKNQSHKCFNVPIVQLNSKSISKSKYFDSQIANDEKHLWNKSSTSNTLHSKPLKSFTVFDKSEVIVKTKKWKNDSSEAKTCKSSTLSLHIAAYENYIENAYTVTLDKNEGLKKNLIKEQKQSLSNSALNQFEFPRQQTDDETDPAVMQFSASQQLLNPNQMGSSNNNGQGTQNIAGVRSALIHFNQRPSTTTAQNFGTAMGKRKKNSEGNKEHQQIGGETAEIPPSKKSKKKKLQEEEPPEEEEVDINGIEDNNLDVEEEEEESTEAEAKKPRKKRTKRKKKEIVNGGEISDIEQHYVMAVRVKVDDDGEFYRLNGRLADLETKVYDISEDEWNPDDPLNMPPQGILVDGLPFHHCYPYPLQRQHIRRLNAHGITLKANYFSPGEDEQIIENWRIYARKTGLDFEDAPLYCGWAKHLGIELPMSLKKFHRKTKFLPYICRGLLDRSAIQVYRRCYRIFDPRNDEFGRQHEEEWTEEDDQRLQALYNIEGPSWQKIAVQMRRNRFQVQTRYHRVLCGEKSKQIPTQSKSKLMFIKDDENFRGVIYDHAKNLLPAHPLVLVTKGIGDEQDKRIDWQQLCKKYSNLNAAKCQAEWSKIKSQLRAAYNREKNPSVTFSAIEKSVFGTNPKRFHNLKPKIAYKAFKILSELVKEKEIEELWEIDVAELTTRLKEAEILFFTCYTLGSHILRTAHRLLTTLKQNCLLNVLPLQTSLAELIEMLAYFMKKSKRKLRLSKVECLHYIQRFIKRKGWTPNDKFAVINKKELEQLEALRAADGDSDNENDEEEEDGEKESEDDEDKEEGNVESENESAPVADDEDDDGDEESDANQVEDDSDSD